MTVAEAVILILKHATFLRFSNPNFFSSESALSHAELEYRTANVDSKVQQVLTTSSQEQTIELFASFVMTTVIGLFILQVQVASVE